MQLSKRAQYGLRAIICLADFYQHGYMLTREVAQREEIPTKFLESILATLTRAKLLESRIGTKGGYRLSRAPKKILIADLLATLEGRKLIGYEAEDAVERTPGEVAVGLLQNHLANALRGVLDTFTLADLIDQIKTGAGRGTMFYI